MDKDTASVTWYILYILLVVTTEAECSSCWQPMVTKMVVVVSLSLNLSVSMHNLIEISYYLERPGWNHIKPCSTWTFGQRILECEQRMRSTKM